MQILNKYSVLEEILQTIMLWNPCRLEITKKIYFFQCELLYKVLNVKTLSQNGSIGIITSYHCLTEIRTNSAARKK